MAKHPTFKEATDLLCMTAPQLAEFFGVSAQTIRQARLDPESPGYRTPPDGWVDRLAAEAEARGEALEGLAKSLRERSDAAAKIRFRSGDPRG